jgi:LuxR family transcriptional regulator, maltose regulon positive regulatory protein
VQPPKPSYGPAGNGSATSGHRDLRCARGRRTLVYAAGSAGWSMGAGMPGRLLSTKFFIPGPLESTVDRPRVSELLDRAAQTKLALVSAQAGFGKTTAIANWIHHGRGPDEVAWVSLEPSDARADSFWAYVITALARLLPDLHEVLPLLDGGGLPMAAVLTELVNQLADAPGDVVLVLDDYHVVDNPSIAEGMSFLLNNLPRQIHVVLSTRSDPDVPLSRLRARGEVVEVRAADLRFTDMEAARYLSELGLHLDQSDLSLLEDRTEGWAAALQLAALSMRGRQDLSGFVADFAGDDRFIVDYLVDEVLARLPQGTRDFLMRTSVLDRLTGPLCDAVTGQAGGAQTLQELERQNLFVVPLDNRRRWYRYHHLFGEVLRTHLVTDTESPSPAALHSSASIWYEQNGQPREAVRHALVAGDHGRTANLMELAIPELLRQRQEVVIAEWVDALPSEVVHDRPVLAMGFIAALMSCNEFPRVTRRLDDLEPVLRRLATSDTPDLATLPDLNVQDSSELQRLAGKAELYRAGLALVAGDLAATHRHVGRVNELAAPDDYPTRAGAWGLSGLAHWRVGELEALHDCYSRCIDELKHAGHVADIVGCSTTLADVRVTQGRLRDAEQTLERALALAAAEEGTVRGVADMHRGVAEIALERDDVDAAEAHLRRAQELGERAGMPQHPYRLRVTMALARQARADNDEAMALLEEAERVYVADFMPNVRPVPATRARLLVATGRLSEAHAWAVRHGLSTADDPSYVREYEHVTLAMLLLADYTVSHSADAFDELSSWLEQLHDASEAGGRTRTLIEVLILQSLLSSTAGQPDAAAATLERAVSLGEPERLSRVFTIHGTALAPILRLLPALGHDSAYIRYLIAACAPKDVTEDTTPPVPEALVDALSQRELEVLRLLATDLTGPELARHLVVSLNTLRTHTRNVYAKLGVSGRRAAVSRARELHLLGRRDS